MSKYIRDLTEQLKGKNIAHFTKELQASQDLKVILKDQNDMKKRAKINADIQKLLAR